MCEAKVFEETTDGVFLIDGTFDECEAFAIRKTEETGAFEETS